MKLKHHNFWMFWGMKFKFRGRPQVMMGICMRTRTHLVFFGHLQVKMSRYSAPERARFVHLSDWDSALRDWEVSRMTVWCAMPNRGIIGPIFVVCQIIAEKYAKFLENSFDSINQCDPDFDKLCSYKTQIESIGPRKYLMSWRSNFRTAFWIWDTQKPLEMKLAWPPYSPDLNKCDYIYGALLKKMCT